MEADELHHLGGEFLPLGGAVAQPGMVHQVGQAHDAQPDAPGAMGCFLEDRHGRDVGIGIHHVIQEDGREDDALLAGDPNPPALPDRSVPPG